MRTTHPLKGGRYATAQQASQTPVPSVKGGEELACVGANPLGLAATAGLSEEAHATGRVALLDT